MKQRHIIIGSSAAGIGALTRLCKLDADAKIICISQDPHMPYNTCLLVDYLSGSTQDVHTKAASFFADNHIDVRLDTKVISLNGHDKTITLSSGQTLSYDTLFLGLGSSPRMLTIPGSEKLSSVMKFHTLSDTYAIMNYIAQHNVRSATIVGAGLSGIECADALVTKGLSVNLVEQRDRILSSHVDDGGAAFISAKMKKRGVTIYTGIRVEEVQGQNGVVHSVSLSDGTTLPTDLLIFTTGSKPNSKLAKDAGIVVEKGRIITNEYMQTSLPYIYAGGDCALVKDIVTGNHIPNTTWPDAMQQGMYAAMNMTGNPKPYPGLLPISNSLFFDLSFVSCGAIATPPNGSRVITQRGEDFFHQFVLKDDSLAGFVMIGKVRDLGQFRRLMISKETVPLSLIG